MSAELHLINILHLSQVSRPRIFVGPSYAFIQTNEIATQFFIGLIKTNRNKQMSSARSFNQVLYMGLNQSMIKSSLNVLFGQLIQVFSCGTYNSHQLLLLLPNLLVGYIFPAMHEAIVLALRMANFLLHLKTMFRH